MQDLIERIKAKGFQLGGSRRMAEKYPERFNLAESTDYDFYCPDTKENRDFLANEGFVVVAAINKNYWDTLLVDIYKHRQYPIEVLIRSNCVIYTQAFDSISADVFYYRLWKSCPEVAMDDLNAFRASVCAYFCSLFFDYGGVKW